jgi:23S rRNA pseudouridine2605 synthase
MQDEIMTDTPADAKPPAERRAGQRIAKAMARAGLCSRRDAEGWIAAGRVSVNGVVLTSPAFNVGPDDDVRVDGEPLNARERTRLFLFHKPRGLMTTARDPEGRRTIFEALPKDLPRLVAVGRLDFNTEGLLLLTNDGGLARVLELPATGWLRRYRVRAHGAVDQARLEELREGVTIDGIHYAGVEARLERVQGSNVWIAMGLREGKNREIKRVLEHLGLSVNRLIRVAFGPFELADLAAGEVAEVRTRVLRDQLGHRLAREAGVDFEAPIVDRAPPPPPPPEQAEPSRTRAPRRGREDVERRPARAGPKPARQERRPAPAPSSPERKRKHVSALRAAITAEAASGPRKRIERAETSDRKGRRVEVERILPTREELTRREHAGKRAAPHRRQDAEAGFGPRARPLKKRPVGERPDSRAGRAPPRGSKPGGDKPPRRG